ncbi:MAG: ribosome recycling factor [Firmicutes bacterium]|nr:ribosome recycling factor [Bacillota bacterium]
MKDLLKTTEEHMRGVVETARREFMAVRTGRANPAILERVVVEYYGVPTPLNQVSNIIAPEPRMLVVQPWEKNMLGPIEKAILNADLGLTPTNDGYVIRIVIPPLTEERRRELVKLVRKEAEEKRVAVRNARREANEKIKGMQKAGEITEDQEKKALEDVQKLTDKYIEEIDKLLETKEREIMEV